MRGLLVLLVACGGAAVQPVRVEHHADPAARAAPAATPDLRARIDIEGSSSWIDIQVDGTDDAARTFCERLVERELRGPHGVVAVRVARACAAEALPAPVDRGAYRLVDREQVASDDVSVDDLIAGHRESLAHATGQVLRVDPQRDHRECEATKAQADAADQRAWLRAQQDRRVFLDEQIAAGRDREKRACDKVQQLEPCARRPPDARATCEVLRDDVERTCNRATEELRVLEQKRAQPEEAPNSRYRCEPR